MPDWDSLKFHNSEDGSKVRLIDDSSGIISFMVFSRTEKNLMTYKPSGDITFKDLSTGTVILQKNSVSNLTNICLSGDRNYLIGAKNNIVYLIDILTGNILDQIEIENIYDISTANNNVLCYSKTDSTENITYLRILFNKFNFTSNPLLQLKNDDITSAVIGNTTVYYGDKNGNIKEDFRKEKD